MAPSFSLLALLSLLPLLTLAARPLNPPGDLVRSSCLNASYPSLCVRTLSPYAGPASTPADLVQAAVEVSLIHARNLTRYLSRTDAGAGKCSRSRRMAIRGCIEQISDSADELKKTLEELRRLKSGAFEMRVRNAETWISAALTDEDTCLDGFKELGLNLKGEVKKKIGILAEVTSNALYLVHRLRENRESAAHGLL